VTEHLCRDAQARSFGAHPLPEEDGDIVAGLLEGSREAKCIRSDAGAGHPAKMRTVDQYRRRLHRLTFSTFQD